MILREGGGKKGTVDTEANFGLYMGKWEGKIIQKLVINNNTYTVTKAVAIVQKTRIRINLQILDSFS